MTAPTVKVKPPIEKIREALSYDAETGLIYWNYRPVSHFTTEGFCRMWNNKHAGTLAGFPVKGYIRIRFLGFAIYAHTAAWVIVHGKYPDGFLDHINGNRKDNRMSNLRTVSRTENNRNARKSRKNNSGVTGVSFHRQTGKWRAQIGHHNKRIHLGEFDRIEDAAATRTAAEQRFGYHDNHGRRSAAEKEGKP